MSTRDSVVTRPLNCSVRTSGCVCTCTVDAAGGRSIIQASSASKTVPAAPARAQSFRVIRIIVARTR
jgi:hypothetical protein